MAFVFKKLTAIFLLTSASTLAAGCSGGGSSGDDEESFPAAVRFLYVQEASSGRVTARRDSRDISIVLEGTGSETIFLSQDTDHQTGSLDTGQFVDYFSWTPIRPNAALVFQTAAGKKTALVELGVPIYDPQAGTIQYPLTLLDGTDARALDDFSDDPVDFIPDSFSAANLFIDDGTLISCSGIMASETIIGRNTDDKTVGSLAQGDEISASSDGQIFSQNALVFAASAPAEDRRMVVIQAGDDKLIGAEDLCAVRGDNSVVFLRDILPGDRLRFSDGSIRTVDLASRGDYSGPVSAVSTAAENHPGSGKFIQAGGFVVTEHLWTGSAD